MPKTPRSGGGPHAASANLDGRLPRPCFCMLSLSAVMVMTLGACPSPTRLQSQAPQGNRDNLDTQFRKLHREEAPAEAEPQNARFVLI